MFCYHTVSLMLWFWGWIWPCPQNHIPLDPKDAKDQIRKNLRHWSTLSKAMFPFPSSEAYCATYCWNKISMTLYKFMKGENSRRVNAIENRQCSCKQPPIYLLSMINTMRIALESNSQIAMRTSYMPFKWSKLVSTIKCNLSPLNPKV